MLEMLVNNDHYEEVAENILNAHAQRVHPGTFENVLEGILDGLKGGSAVEKLTIHTVDFREDGTTLVEPKAMDNGNPYFVAEFLENAGKTLMVSNEKGDTLCIAPIQVNGTTYLQTFKPEEAQTVRDALKAQMEPPRKLSLFDKFCDLCARAFLKRPGKAAAEYNAAKEAYDAMQGAFDKLGSIPDKVEGYKQEKAQQEQAEKERLEQERLEKERLEQENLEKERLEQERLEAERQQKELEEQLRNEQIKREAEEAQKKALEEQKRQRELEFQKKASEIREKEIQRLEKEIPENEKELAAVTKLRQDVKKDLDKAEMNLQKIKEAVETDKKYLIRENDDLKAIKTKMGTLTEQLKEQDQLKEFAGKKQEASEKMEAARNARDKADADLKAAQEEQKLREKEWAEVAPNGHIYAMTPKQYLEYDYEQKRVEREKQFNDQRNERLEKMEQQQLKIDAIAKQISGYKDASTGFEKSFLGGLTFNGRNLNKLAEMKEKEEKEYQKLQQEDELKRKEFEKAEAQIKQDSMNLTPEQMKGVTTYLEMGKADHLAKFNAHNSAKDKVEQLTQEWNKQNKAYSSAKRDYNQWNDQMNGKEYFPSVHEDMKEQKEQLVGKYSEQTLRVSALAQEIKERKLLIQQGENGLEPTRKRFSQLDEKYHTLTNRVAGDKSVLNKLQELHQASPNLAGNQPQVQNQAQPQPQPKGMGGPGM